uniref:G-protein coupled receptors family 1 profile domain-containing protein n=1 Tax=Romanomermis culicivorax TaxID=13658 RepID=A0A915IED2_ROMCU
MTEIFLLASSIWTVDGYNRQNLTTTNRAPAAVTDEFPSSTAENWPVAFLSGFIIFGVFGNSLICLAISTDRRLQNPTNYFLLSLAVADLLVCVLVMPFSIATTWNGGIWLFDFPVCAFHIYTDVFLCSASIVHITSISLDRYIGISRPLTNRYRSKSVVAFKIVIVWILTVLISFPLLLVIFLKKSDIFDPIRSVCQINNKLYMIYGSILAFVIPLIINLVTYLRTTRLLKQQAMLCCSSSKELSKEGRARRIRRSKSQKATSSSSTTYNSGNTYKFNSTSHYRCASKHLFINEKSVQQHQNRKPTATYVFLQSKSGRKSTNSCDQQVTKFKDLSDTLLPKSTTKINVWPGNHEDRSNISTKKNSNVDEEQRLRISDDYDDLDDNLRVIEKDDHTITTLSAEREALITGARRASSFNNEQVVYNYVVRNELANKPSKTCFYSDSFAQRSKSSGSQEEKDFYHSRHKHSSITSSSDANGTKRSAVAVSTIRTLWAKMLPFRKSGVSSQPQHSPTLSKFVSASSAASTPQMARRAKSGGYHTPVPGPASYSKAREVATEQKATRVLGLVFACFFFCWTPFFALNLAHASYARFEAPFALETLFVWLGFVSSTINPLIFTIFNKRFRQSFARIIACCTRYDFRGQMIFGDGYSNTRTPAMAAAILAVNNNSVSATPVARFSHTNL